LALAVAASILATEGLAEACQVFAGEGSGCFDADPCGRQPGMDYDPLCNSFTQVDDNRVLQLVTCPACPGGGQCGATVTSDQTHVTYYQDTWCFETCAQMGAECGDVEAMSPLPHSQAHGVTMNCGTCASGKTCQSNKCCGVCPSNFCGALDDGCGHTLNCTLANPRLCAKPVPAAPVTDLGGMTILLAAVGAVASFRRRSRTT